MNIAKIASKIFGKGSLLLIEPFYLKNDLNSANPEEILLIDLREFVLICLYYLALKK